MSTYHWLNFPGPKNVQNVSVQLIILERALRALASSSGGAACPGGTLGQPGGQPQESGSDPKAI